jgi:hypothetical protein
LRRARRCSHRQRHALRAAALAILAGNWEGVAEDGFEDQAVRSGGEAIADAELDIELLHLKIGNSEQLLALLRQRQEIADFAEVGIVFEADKSIFAKIAGEPRRRRNVGFATAAEADVDNRIDDELPFFVARADDRPDLQHPWRLRELRHLVAELEIDAIEKAAFLGVGTHKQAADLGAIGQALPCATDCERQIEAGLPSVGDAIGKLRRALQAVIRCEAAGEFWHRLPDRRKVKVLLIGPLPDLGDVSVVDLDFIVDLVDGRCRAGSQRDDHGNGRGEEKTWCHAAL